MRKKYAIANWKMNQDLKSIEAFFFEFNNHNFKGEFVIAPQAIHLAKCLELSKSAAISAQNIASENEGAFTGDSSPKSIKEMGVNYTLIGHSERRQSYGETPELTCKKLAKAFENKLTPVFCIGESLKEREAGKTLDILHSQLKAGFGELNLENQEIIVAYEPVWAIGTGKTPTSQEVQELHAQIRKYLEDQYKRPDISILYGGSVKAENAGDFVQQEDIDGVLVGGASLKASSFLGICERINSLH